MAVIVVDTSVLMSDPDSLTAYPDSSMVVPLTVVDELDSNASRQDAPGANARAVLRILEALRQDHDGDLSVDVPIGDGGATVRVELNGISSSAVAEHLDLSVDDHRILSSALTLQEQGQDVVLLSNDAAMRLKAAALGLSAKEHARLAAPLAAGVHVIQVGSHLIDDLYSSPGDVDLPEEVLDTPVNSFLVLQAGSASILLRRTVDGVRLLPRGAHNQVEAWGLHARSKEQAFALDLLHDRDLPLVALLGAAGTGKTILALAAGLQQVFEEGTYDRLMVLRPVISVGRQDLGFLPGELNEKLGPWFETIVDTMVALSSTGQTHAQCRQQLDLWTSTGRLVTEPVTFMRGRSLQSTFVIVDECQNLEPSVVKTLVTRLGDGSKGVLIGDESQVDNPWTSPTRNGLTSLVSAFTGEREFGFVRLSKGERSRIATLASERM